jgi:hypothetical protein
MGYVKLHSNMTRQAVIQKEIELTEWFLSTNPEPVARKIAEIDLAKLRLQL